MTEKKDDTNLECNYELSLKKDDLIRMMDSLWTLTNRPGWSNYEHHLAKELRGSIYRGIKLDDPSEKEKLIRELLRKRLLTEDQLES